MIKWYLVLYVIGTSSSSMISIPQAYNDKQVCEEAAKDWDSWGSGRNHMCVKAPKMDINLGVGATKDKGYVCQPGATTCEVVK